MERYDPTSDTWAAALELGESRVALASCTLDGKIYAIGGSPGPWPFEPISTLEMYDLE